MMQQRRPLAVLLIGTALATLRLPSLVLAAQLESYGTYTPATDVSDYAAIALDQAELEFAVVQHEDDDDPAQMIDWAPALSQMLSIYRNGGNSGTYARLTLSHPLQNEALEGLEVSLLTGNSSSTPEIVGSLLNTAQVGAMQIDVLYNTDDRVKICRAGFLLVPSTDHCFPAIGTVWFGDQRDTLYEYAYDPTADTLSDRTIRGFSIDESIHHEFEQESNPLHTSMAIFKVYYGVTDYADRIVWSALTKGDAGFERGNMDFSSVNDRAVAEATMRGTVVLHIFMMVMRQLEESINLCKRGTVANSNIELEPVRALDKAVAYYTGFPDDHLLYFLANTMCTQFNTCKEDNALVNENIFFDFNLLKQFYENDKDCNDAELLLEDRLLTQLKVPLVQATLFYAYLQRIRAESTPSQNAEGAIFAASILPFVHACSADDANLIYEQMKLGRESAAEFSVVKGALERNYQCMGVSCSDIGGVYNQFGHPQGAEPCGDTEPPEASSTDSESTSPTPTPPEIVASSYESFASYTPTTFVADHAAIAMDQAELDYLVRQDITLTNDEIIARIATVYQQGSNSRAYARLTLSRPMETTSFKSTSVAVIAKGGPTINGELLETAVPGETVINVRYISEENPCRIGWFLKPSLEYCFPDAGVILIEGNDNEEALYEYHYLPFDDTLSGKTIQSFSIDAALHHVLGSATAPLHPTMAIFNDYYGVVDYADRIVTSALTHDDPGLMHDRDFDFSNFHTGGMDAAAGAITGTVVLNMFMMVLRELEHSLDLCSAELNDDLNFGDPSHALDKAVAYYMGSLDGNVVGNNTNPHLMYLVAENMCTMFNTCEEGETSRINGDIFSDFNALQAVYLRGSDCREATDIVYGSIINELYIPLIQGTLLFGYLQRSEAAIGNDRPAEHHANGSMFAASILPILHSCNEHDAAFVHDQMKPTQKQPVDFFELKRALERNYECMGISCFDVGGISVEGHYFPETKPCDAASITDDEEDVVDFKISTTAFWVLFNSSVVAIAFLCTSVCLYGRVRFLRLRRDSDIEKDGVIADKTLELDHMFDEEIDFEIRHVTVPSFIELT